MKKSLATVFQLRGCEVRELAKVYVSVTIYPTCLLYVAVSFTRKNALTRVKQRYLRVELRKVVHSDLQQFKPSFVDADQRGEQVGGNTHGKILLTYSAPHLVVRRLESRHANGIMFWFHDMPFLLDIAMSALVCLVPSLYRPTASCKIVPVASSLSSICTCPTPSQHLRFEEFCHMIHVCLFFSKCLHFSRDTT